VFYHFSRPYGTSDGTFADRGPSDKSLGSCQPPLRGTVAAARRLLINLAQINSLRITSIVSAICYLITPYVNCITCAPRGATHEAVRKTGKRPWGLGRGVSRIEYEARSTKYTVVSTKTKDQKPKRDSNRF
jgi:hypothetical protein